MIDIKRVVAQVDALRAENVRLRAVNAQLLEALKEAIRYLPHGDRYEGPFMLKPEDAAAFRQSYAAIAAAEAGA